MSNGPDNWATPITADGLTNFWQVSANLYRGAEPTDATGFASLAALGINTVIDLETFSTDGEPDIECVAGMNYIHMLMEPYHIEDEDVVAFLQVVADNEHPPVFVHCVYGSDRTGTLCAMYRIRWQDWSADEAIAEFADPRFGTHWEWRDIDEAYIRNADIEKIKREARIP